MGLDHYNNTLNHLFFLKTNTMNKYTQTDLDQFQSLIFAKLATAEASLKDLKDNLSKSGNGTSDTSWQFSVIDDGAETLSKEESSALAHRQQTLVEQYKLALERIKIGTYGICSVSGEIIPRERLLAMPHALTVVNPKSWTE